MSFPLLDNWHSWQGTYGYAHADPFSRPLPIPASGVLDNPDTTICINSEWMPILTGVLRRLVKEELYIVDGVHDGVWAANEALKLIGAIAGGDNPCVESNCIDYPSSANIITYSPQNPFSEPDLIPSGYLTTPFTQFSNFGLIGWLSSWFPAFTEALTGYLPDDIIVDISSLPLLANWSDLLSGVMPQIAISMTGVGTAELHLINFPLGGRAIITVDVQPNLADIFLGVLGNAEIAVELNRDILSLPIESPSIVIHEIEIDTEGAHAIYITFVPVIDDALIPINFGGGLRKVVLCGFDEVIMPIVEDVRITDCGLEKYINGQWIAAGDLTTCVTDITTPIQNQVDDNATDIGSNTGDISDNADDIQDNQDAQDSNVYPDPPTSVEPDETCGAAWYVAEQLEALCQDALADAQTITLIEWLDGLMAGGGWQSSILVQLWNFAYANVNPNLSTELSDAIPELAEILYCNDLSQATTKTEVAASGISADAKVFYDAAIDSLVSSTWKKWIFLGSQDLTRDCSGFCSSGPWCYRFDFSQGLQGWSPTYGVVSGRGIETQHYTWGGHTFHGLEMRLDLSSYGNIDTVRAYAFVDEAQIYNSVVKWKLQYETAGTGGVQLIDGSWTVTNYPMDYTFDCDDWSDIIVILNVAAKASGQYPGTPSGFLGYVEFTGTGVNPFGEDNCP